VHHRGSNKKEWLLTLLNLAPTNFWLVRDFFEKNHQILWWFQFFFVPLWWKKRRQVVSVHLLLGIP
jgi:hypothetical protein